MTKQNLTITMARLTDWGACTEGKIAFARAFPQGGEFAEVYTKARDENQYSNAEWLLEHVFAELDTAGIVGQSVAIGGADKTAIAKAISEASEGVEAASGDYSKLAASGDSSQLAASGDYSKLAASGDYSKLAASGYYSKLAASGYSSQLAASGDYSKLAASGGYSQLAASGENSCAMAAAPNCSASAGEGGAIALRWTTPDGRPRIAVAYIGENGIKPDVLYRLNGNGEFVESAS